jgi:hypothetical protein
VLTTITLQNAVFAHFRRGVSTRPRLYSIKHGSAILVVGASDSFPRWCSMWSGRGECSTVVEEVLKIEIVRRKGRTAIGSENKGKAQMFGAGRGAPRPTNADRGESVRSMRPRLRRLKRLHGSEASRARRGSPIRIGRDRDDCDQIVEGPFVGEHSSNDGWIGERRNLRFIEPRHGGLGLPHRALGMNPCARVDSLMADRATEPG